MTLNEYEIYSDSIFTYTEEDAMRYPHREVEVVEKKAFGRWETTTYKGCESDDPNDCQVLCYRTYPAEKITFYEPVDTSLGNPYWDYYEVQKMVSKGGLTSYEEIDCKWAQVNVLPLSFSAENQSLSDQDKQLVEDNLLYLFRRYPEIRLSLSVYVSAYGDALKNQTLADDLGIVILNYLKSVGIGEEQLVITGFPKTLAPASVIKETNGGESVSNPTIRVEFKALLVEQPVKQTRSRQQRKKGKRRKRTTEGD